MKKWMGSSINEDIPFEVNVIEELSRCYRPIFNVIKFYNIFGILRFPSEVMEINNNSNLPDCLIGAHSLVAGSTGK